MNKAEIIYGECRRELEQLEPGASAPSVREFMRRFQVSQSTVTRALDRLKAEGLLISRVGMGSCRSDGTPENPRLRVQFFYLDYPSTFTAAVRTNFERHFAQQGHRLEATSFTNADFAEGRLKFKPNVDGAVLFCHQHVPAALQAQLTAWGRPVVFADIVPANLAADAVCADNEAGGALVAEWFWRHGHRKFAWLQSQPHFDAPLARVRGFVGYLRGKGVRCAQLDAGTEPGSNATAAAYEVFAKRVDEGALSFTALFCDSDLGGLGVLRACHERRIAVPQDLSVFGFDNIPECGFFYPALSSVDQCPGRWAEKAEAILVKRYAGESGAPIHRLIAPELVVRPSVCSCLCDEKVMIG